MYQIGDLKELIFGVGPKSTLTILYSLPKH